MSRHVAHLLLAPLVLLLQWLVFSRLKLWGAYPDIVLLYAAWFALRHGRMPGALMGFVLGLTMDALYGTWGMHAMVKTLTSFMLGFFHLPDEEFRIRPSQTMLGSFLLSLIHNGLLVLLYAFQTRAQTSFLLWALWLGSSLYTALIGGFFSLLTQRHTRI